MTNTSEDADYASELQRADPEDVDREAVMALGECPTHGEKSLATASVEDAVYLAECGLGGCDHVVRAPVVDKDGSLVVMFDRDPEEVPLP